MARQMTKRQSTRNNTLGMRTDCTAIYIRVSTERQAEDGYSLESQQQRLNALCLANGWPVCEEHIYVDAGESAKSDARPAYRRLRDAIEAGSVTRLVVTRLDRLSRNTRDFLTLLDYCDAHGVAIVSIAEAFDTGTATGRAVVTVLMAFAELERKTITNRVMTGKATKAGDGGYNGSYCPYGYRYDTGTFVVDDERADVVRRIFAAFIVGAGMTEIASQLNDTRTPTARGGQWSASSVRYILRNGAYAGVAQWDGVEAQTGEHPAIISAEDYNSAIARLGTLRPGRQKRCD